MLEIEVSGEDPGNVLVFSSKADVQNYLWAMSMTYIAPVVDVLWITVWVPRPHLIQSRAQLLAIHCMIYQEGGLVWHVTKTNQ